MSLVFATPFGRGLSMLHVDYLRPLSNHSTPRSPKPKRTTPPATEDAPRLRRIVYASPRCVCIDTSGVMSLVTSARPSARPLSCATPSILLFPESEVLRKKSFVLETGQARPDAVRQPNVCQPPVKSLAEDQVCRSLCWLESRLRSWRPSGRPSGRPIAPKLLFWLCWAVLDGACERDSII